MFGVILTFIKKNDFTQPKKPIKLIKRLIQASSNENDLVLDPFGGSGATALACLALKRQFITIELDENYYQVILERVKEILEPQGLFNSIYMV